MGSLTKITVKQLYTVEAAKRRLEKN